MSTSSVTVLLTVFNGMPYLRETVDSVLAQELRDFRFLILNNGSEDGTGEFLAGIEKREDPRVTVEHLPENIGRTAVLNRGLAMVQTPLTAIIDADDLAAPDRLARQCAFMEAHPEVDLVGCDVVYIDRNGNTLGEQHFPEGHAELCNRLPLFNQFAHAGCCFRTRAALAVGGYPSAYPYAQDFGLWLAMLAAGSIVASIAAPLARIRVHPGQATRDLRLLVVRSQDDHNLAEAMLAVPGIAPASRQAALFRSAAALARLGRYKEAASRLWRGITEAPLALPVNPILWERLTVEWKKLMSRFLKKETRP